MRFLKLYIFLLLLLTTVACRAQVYPQQQPSKPLESLTASELNILFDEANANYKKQAVQNYADTLCKKLNGTLLIAQNDQVLVEKAAGVKVLGKSNNPIVVGTCFELASVSKEFTAAAVLQLVESGKVNLNDYLGKYFPGLPYTGITVENLLNHTSGLPEYFDFKESWWPVGRLTTNEDVVKTLITHNPKILFQPGTQYKYTNTNYALLALIVEKASGEKFEDYMRKNIFEPAGMTHSFYITERAGKTGFSIATGHKADRVPQVIKGLDGTFGDKGMYSNVEDLFAWKKAYFTDYKILSKEMVEAATSKCNFLKNGKKPSEEYGYGWHLENSPCYGKLIYHGGLWHGFNHVLLYYREADLFMVFLTNYCNRATRGQTAVVLHLMCGA
ncbi:MAG: beta-lactamase family protein [Bacteroidales bacterium]|nr:beta-lactamase family protein [Bacteroidales bacterium]